MKTQLDKHLFLASHAQAQLFSHKYKTKKPSPIIRYVVIGLLLSMGLSSRGQQQGEIALPKDAFRIPQFSHIDTAKSQRILIGSVTDAGDLFSLQATNSVAKITMFAPKTLIIEEKSIISQSKRIDTVIIGNRIYTLKKATE